MATLEQNIAEIQQIKTDLKDAFAEKGISASDDMRDYADYVLSLYSEEDIPTEPVQVLDMANSGFTFNGFTNETCTITCTNWENVSSIGGFFSGANLRDYSFLEGVTFKYDNNTSSMFNECKAEELDLHTCSFNKRSTWAQANYMFAGMSVKKLNIRGFIGSNVGACQYFLSYSNGLQWLDARGMGFVATAAANNFANFWGFGFTGNFDNLTTIVGDATPEELLASGEWVFKHGGMYGIVNWTKTPNLNRASIIGIANGVADTGATNWAIPQAQYDKLEASDIQHFINKGLTITVSE